MTAEKSHHLDETDLKSSNDEGENEFNKLLVPKLENNDDDDDNDGVTNNLCSVKEDETNF